MPQVETVRGSVDTSSLGQTLMHEHVFVLSPEINHNYPEMSWSGRKESRIADAKEKLHDLRQRGIRTLVDLTVLGLGRDITNIKLVNDNVDINIIVATGLYTFDELPTYLANRPPGFSGGNSDDDLMIEMFVRDLTEGIADTGVRAAILKCCTETQGVTPGIDRVLRAVARSHRLTGAPISTHSNPAYRTGLEQQRVFAEEGVDLSRVVIGHSGDTTDLYYLRELMDKGSSIGMDRCGLYLNTLPTFEERVETLAALCTQGYADRMVLSHDAACHIDKFLPMSEVPLWNYNHISDAVVPALQRNGVSDEDIQVMLVDNPRHIFENVGAY